MSSGGCGRSGWRWLQASEDQLGREMKGSSLQARVAGEQLEALSAAGVGRSGWCLSAGAVVPAL